MDNISLVTYAGQTVTPLDDALVYETAINQSGMIYGGTVTIKSANNLHISSGHGIVCGRKFTIFDSDIQVALSSSGTLLGRLYVQLDLSNVGTPIQLLVETGASLTPVQQDNNVNIMNGVFEFNIATFTVDTSTISNVIMVAPSAEPSTGAGSVITVTTSEASLAGKMCTITDGTTTLNANFDNTGKAVFYGVQMVGRVLVNATDGEYYASGEVNITYFGLYSTSIAFWGATINLSTTTPEFYGQNITVEQDGILVSTISFDGTGHATYIAPALGVYDFTVTYGGNEYTATVNVTEETTYSKSIDIAPAGLDLSAWITAGSTTDYPLNPSSYADFSALEADEAAVRQLMTVHDAVDYLATATAGDSLMQSVINSDVCAKWINLSDYALDTLSANSDIASEMSTADKYGYGEWGKIDSTTWGALGNVPIMTANNAPYGTAGNSSAHSSGSYPAYKAFNGDVNTEGWLPDSSDTVGNCKVYYQAVNPMDIKKASVYMRNSSGSNAPKVKIIASDDGTTWQDVSEEVALTVNTWVDIDVESTYHPYIGMKISAMGTLTALTNGQGYKLQFYGRELKPLVPTMTSNTTPKGEASGSNYYDLRFEYYKAFDGNWSDRGWLPSTDSYPQHLQYDFAETVCPKEMKIEAYSNTVFTSNTQVEVRGSNDNYATYDTIGTYTIANGATIYNVLLSATAEYKAVRLYLINGPGATNGGGYKLQFYGMDYSEKEFATGSTRKTIYDHGVKPSGAITGGTDDGNNLTLSAVGTATVTIDKGTRTYMGGKVGLHASGTNRLKCGSGYSAFTASNMPDSNGFDISSISGSVAVGIEQTASGTFDCTEIWIE